MMGSIVRRKGNAMRKLLCGAVLAALLTTDAAAGVAGTYRCSSYNVDGLGGSCANLASIVLNASGSYQISSETGTYTASGDLVTLTPASATWGTGKLQGGNQLVFDYVFGGRRQVVTYTCQDCISIVNWSISGGISGSASQQVLNLAIRPGPDDYYRPGNLYIAALAGSRVFFLKNRGNVFFTTSPVGDFDVVAWTGGALPVFTSIELEPTITFSLKVGDTTGLSGIEVWAGYGLNDDDLLAKGKYARVNVFP